MGLIPWSRESKVQRVHPSEVLSPAVNEVGQFVPDYDPKTDLLLDMDLSDPNPRRTKLDTAKACLRVLDLLDASARLASKGHPKGHFFFRRCDEALFLEKAMGMRIGVERVKGGVQVTVSSPEYRAAYEDPGAIVIGARNVAELRPALIENGVAPGTSLFRHAMKESVIREVKELRYAYLSVISDGYPEDYFEQAVAKAHPDVQQFALGASGQHLLNQAKMEFNVNRQARAYVQEISDNTRKEIFQQTKWKADSGQPTKQVIARAMGEFSKKTRALAERVVEAFRKGW